MEVRGCIPVKATTAEGQRLNLPFHDADVSMPIMSAATLASDDQFDVNFSKKGGTVYEDSTVQSIHQTSWCIFHEDTGT